MHRIGICRNMNARASRKSFPWPDSLKFSRYMSSLPFTTVEADKKCGSQPIEVHNLVQGKWVESCSWSTLVDPLNSEPLIKIAEFDKSEIKPFVESLSRCPKHGLHNPFKSPERYLLYGGEISTKAGHMLAQPQVSDFFVRLIQRVSLKSYQQAMGQVSVTQKFLENFNWGLPKFGFCNTTLVMGSRHYRAFCSCGEASGSDDEDGGGDDDDDKVSKDSEEVYESSADPEEVGRVAKVIDELFALDRNMEAVLDECGINLTHDLVFDVLQRFKHARKPAFRFFCWAGQKPGFSHNSKTYNAILFILGKTKQFETMGTLLEEMGAKGLLNMDSFMIAIKAYASGKERKKAVGVFELMKKYEFKAGVETIDCMLDALGREKLTKEAQALYDRLKGRFTPNMKTYTVLLSGWCRVKNLMEAGKIWNEMIDQDVKPDLITHNIMLDGLLKLKKRSDAIKLFEVMKAKGPAPNVRSYTILIRDLCKHSKMKEAVAYFDEMQASGCEPDAGVYTCLITGFGNLKKMDMVYALLKEMKEKGYPTDGRLYNALIKLMTNRRMPDDALRIYKKMIQSENQPTIHTYNMMVKSYFLAGNSEMACAVWDEMIQKGCCPDENSYTVLIGGLIRHGRSEEACKYVEEMINKGMRVPELDFNKFAADFSRVGRPNILEELARKMRLSGKSEVSEVFARWAQMTQKRITRRGMVDNDE